VNPKVFVPIGTPTVEGVNTLPDKPVPPVKAKLAPAKVDETKVFRFKVDPLVHTVAVPAVKLGTLFTVATCDAVAVQPFTSVPV